MHVRLCWTVAMIQFALAAVNLQFLEVDAELAAGTLGQLVGDCNYWCPRHHAQSVEQGAQLLAPYCNASRLPHMPRPTPQRVVVAGALSY